MSLFAIRVMMGNLKERSSGSAWTKARARDRRVYFTELVDRENLVHHDAAKLAQTLMALYNERTGPLTKENPTLTALKLP